MRDRLHPKTRNTERTIEFVSIIACSLGILAASLTSCFADNLSYQTPGDTTLPSGGQSAPLVPAITKSAAFGEIYIYSMNFDYCHFQMTGEKFRKILESYYSVCIINTMDGPKNFDYAQEGVKKITDALSNKNTKSINNLIYNGIITNNCSVFLQKTVPLQREIEKLSSSTIKWNIPIDCNSYAWLQQ